MLEEEVEVVEVLEEEVEVVEVAEVVKPGIKRKRSLARSACAQDGRLHAGLPACTRRGTGWTRVAPVGMG